MKRFILAILCLLCFSSAFAQRTTQSCNVLEPKWYLESDSGNVVNAFEVAWPDSSFAEVKNYGVIEWKFDHAMKSGEVDSIGIWCELPAGAVLRICTGSGVDTLPSHDFWSVRTLNGPLPYGLYSAPFSVPGYDTAATYAVAQVTLGRAYIDAACTISNLAGVKLTYMSTDTIFHWYTLPQMVEVFTGTVSEASAALPKDQFYAATNGRKYLFGR